MIDVPDDGRDYREIRAHGIDEPVAYLDVGPKVHPDGFRAGPRRPVLPPKPPTTFDQLTPAARAGIVVLVLMLVGVALVVLGLLAWACVAVWGQVLA